MLFVCCQNVFSVIAFFFYQYVMPTVSLRVCRSDEPISYFLSLSLSLSENCARLQLSHLIDWPSSDVCHTPLMSDSIASRDLRFF